MINRRTLLKVAALSAAMPAFSQALDQVRIYYGFPAGSAGDAVARRVAEQIGGTPYAKNQGIVENKSGAGGRIALDLLKTAPADGSVLTLTPSSPICVYPHIFTKLSYNPFQDFKPVAMAGFMHLGLAVGPLVPPAVKTLQQFLDWAKANPAHAAFASPGAGSTPHFIGSLLGMRSGFEFRHVSYRGTVPGMTDLLAGQIASMVTTAGDYFQHHAAGNIRVLAVSGRQRLPLLKDVPTLAEQGFPELTVEESFAFYAPARTPQQVIERANAAISMAVRQDAVVQSLTGLGVIAQGSSLEELVALHADEYKRWGPLVKKVGFTVDS